MTFRILISETARKYLEDLSSGDRERIIQRLRVLEEQPHRRRSGADIKQLVGTSPPKYRLRIGPFRAVYSIVEQEVRIIDIFRRGRGYR
ncbi:MAG: type II toxin-antitoxin system RelE/ParE family toxin [Thermoplasmata archaeon]